MQLTQLSIKGFKSFGDHVQLNFNEGITGVVGPNGCGKSNIVDAIRWCLGEQKSKTLRSDKMENVIFNGTKNRRASQLAEVSMTFTNTKNILPTEYHEVTIKRKLFRSGESEYYLNGISCRLKDIHQLFMDTGITSNSYAIIELKMVEELLNDKDQARRGMFEEAVGISKFKVRKKETIRKLDQTDEDLERLEDILHEIEKNKRSLERQAKQAKKYRQLKQEYQSLAIHNALKQYLQKQSVIEKISQQLDSQQDIKSNVSADTAKLDAQIEGEKKQLLDEEKALKQLQMEFNGMQQRIHQLTKEKALHQERIQYLRQANEAKQDEVTISNESLSTDLQRFQELQSQLVQKEASFVAIQSAFEALAETHQAQNKLVQDQRALLQKNNTELSQLQQQQAHCEQQLQVWVTQRETNKKIAAQLVDDMAAYQEQFGQTTSSFETQQNKLNELQQRQEVWQQEQMEMKEKLGLLLEKKQAQEAAYNNLQLEWNNKSNEVQLLQSFLTKREGYSEAIRYLKGEIASFTDFPLFSDIITCHASISGLFDHILTPYLDYFIVPTWDEAKQAAQLLAEKDKGQASFFVLEALAELKLQKIEAQHGASILEYLTYDNKYEQLLQHLFQHVYVVKDEVALAGDVLLIHPDQNYTRGSFYLTGGAVNRSSQDDKKLGMALKVQNLQKELTELNKLLEERKQQQEQLAFEIEEYNKKRSEHTQKSLEKELLVVKTELARFESSLNQLQKFISQAEAKKAQLEQNNSSGDDQFQKLQQEVEQAKQAFQQKQASQLEQTTNLAHVEAEFQQTAAQYQEQQVKFHTLKNEVQQLGQAMQFKQENTQRLEKSVQTLQEEMEANIQEMQALKEQQDKMEQALQDQLAQQEQVNQTLQTKENEYYKARGELNQYEKDVQHKRNQREQVDQLIDALTKQLHEEEMQQKSIAERCQVEFEVDDLGALELEEIALTDAQLQTRVGELKAKLAKFGPINEMAQLAFDEMNERYLFLTGQKEDLIDARDALLKTIMEIDQVAKDTFAEGFERIKANFKRVFQTLFTPEDHCDLILADPQQMLDSPIQIMAQPKGKKPLSINQLSGGEKTLTATSLLFAIYLLKPAPFCIFDEVDAPLDDANIDKFNQIIKEFSADSQFIIVTHNKRTMANMDIMYGITMPEQGISKVVAVDLRTAAA